MRPRRLWVKFFLAFTSLLIIVLWVIGFGFTILFKHHFRHIYYERGKEIAETLAYSVRDAVKNNDIPSIVNFTAGTTYTPDVVYVLVYGPAGAILHESGSLILSSNQKKILKPTAADTYSDVIKTPTHPDILNFVSPIREPAPTTDTGESILFGEFPKTTVPARLPPPLGYVQVGMTLTPLYETIALLNWLSLLLLGIVLGTGCAIIIVLTRRILRPIQSLTTGTRMISEGVLGYKIDTGSDDELGELAFSFNQMSQDLKEKADELGEYQNDLEEKVKQRTREIEEVNIRLNRTMLEKQDFLRAVSHDLGAPLANIAGMASSLLRNHSGALPADAADKLRRIAKNAEKEMESIKDLLELSRITSHRLPFETFGINDLLGEIASGLAHQLQEKNIRLIWDRMPTIHAEHSRIKQLFQNLIDNACKYMGEQPHPSIAVRFADNGAHYLFTVADNGVGIPPEDHHAIFHIFRRVKNNLTANTPGKGIGLSTVKTIVESYGGTIRVESEEGKGSSFFIEIPKSALTITRVIPTSPRF